MLSAPSTKRKRDYEEKQDALWFAQHEQRLVDLLKTDEPARPPLAPPHGDANAPAAPAS